MLEGVPHLLSNDIEELIQDLNRLGYDFTTDDIEIVGGSVRALPYSLGYYNREIEDTIGSNE